MSGIHSANVCVPFFAKFFYLFHILSARKTENLPSNLTNTPHFPVLGCFAPPLPSGPRSGKGGFPAPRLYHCGGKPVFSRVCFAGPPELPGAPCRPYPPGVCPLEGSAFRLITQVAFYAESVSAGGQNASGRFSPGPAPELMSQKPEKHETYLLKQQIPRALPYALLAIFSCRLFPCPVNPFRGWKFTNGSLCIFFCKMMDFP